MGKPPQARHCLQKPLASLILLTLVVVLAVENVCANRL